VKKLIIIFLLFLSIDSYSQWTQVSVPTTSGLNNVFFLDENIGYIVGGGEVNGDPNNTDGVILKTIDGGNTWSSIYTYDGISLNHIFVVGSSIYAYGLNGTSQSLQITSTDNGTSWTQSTPSFSTRKMQFSDGIIYVFDFDNNTTYIKKIENGNTTIIATNIGVFGVNGNEVVYVNQNHDTMYKSIDYGLNFQQLNGYPSEFGSNQSTEAKIKSFNNTIIAHYTYPASTSYSFDNGNTWQNTGADNIWYCEIINSSLLLASSQNILVSQINFGQWQQVYTFSDTLRKIYFFDNNLGFVLGDNGLLYRTENGGLSVNDEFLEKKIKIYPNPVKNSIKIEFTDIKIKKIELIDINGKLIKSFSSNFNELKICNIYKGSYILKIETENGVLNKKILIE
jgi:hypothetical protein